MKVRRWVCEGTEMWRGRNVCVTYGDGLARAAGGGRYTYVTLGGGRHVYVTHTLHIRNGSPAQRVGGGAEEANRVRLGRRRDPIIFGEARHEVRQHQLRAGA